MKSAFVSSTPLPCARHKMFGTAVCDSSSPSAPTKRGSTRTVMMAEKKEQKPIKEWLYSKFMHNALWEGDEEIGYEEYFKTAMTAREDQLKKAYQEKDNPQDK